MLGLRSILFASLILLEAVLAASHTITDSDVVSDTLVEVTDSAEATDVEATDVEDSTALVLSSLITLASLIKTTTSALASLTKATTSALVSLASLASPASLASLASLVSLAAASGALITGAATSAAPSLISVLGGTSSASYNPTETYQDPSKILATCGIFGTITDVGTTNVHDGKGLVTYTHTETSTISGSAVTAFTVCGSPICYKYIAVAGVCTTDYYDNFGKDYNGCLIFVAAATLRQSYTGSTPSHTHLGTSATTVDFVNYTQHLYLFCLSGYCGAYQQLCRGADAKTKSGYTSVTYLTTVSGKTTQVATYTPVSEVSKLSLVSATGGADSSTSSHKTSKGEANIVGLYSSLFGTAALLISMVFL